MDNEEYVNLCVSVYSNKLKSLAVSQILPVLNIYRGEVCFNWHVRLNITFAWSLTTEQLEGHSNEEPRYLCLERRNEIPFSPTVKEQLLKTKGPFLGIIGSQLSNFWTSYTYLEEYEFLWIWILHCCRRIRGIISCPKSTKSHLTWSYGWSKYTSGTPTLPLSSE